MCIRDRASSQNMRFDTSPVLGESSSSSLSSSVVPSSSGTSGSSSSISSLAEAEGEGAMLSPGSSGTGGSVNMAVALSVGAALGSTPVSYTHLLGEGYKRV